MNATTRWAVLLSLSGAVSLGYEAVWLRRLGLVLGGSGPATAVTLGAFFGGLGLGGLLADRVHLDRDRAVRAYAGLEGVAALWALCFPLWMALCEPLWITPLRWGAAPLLLLPPATALGATWPLLARHAVGTGAARWYAANTSGAVLGVLVATFALLPALGVRTTEVVLAGLGVGVAALALRGVGPLPAPASSAPRTLEEETFKPTPLGLSMPAVLAGAAACGLCAMALEVVWMRLAAVGFGASVQVMGGVLAVFLAAVAAGAWLGERLADWLGEASDRGLGYALVALGCLALVGTWSWGSLPVVLGELYLRFGPAGMVPSSVALAALGMGGAPLASGAAFSLAVRAVGGSLSKSAGRLYAANTLAGVVGSIAGGLWWLPTLEIQGTVALVSSLAVLAGVLVLRELRWAVVLGVLLFVQPAWDAQLFAVGVYHRISEFETITPRAIRRFATENWELRYYAQGTTAAVAVGQSTRTGNVWLSTNGKVDASTSFDMATQELSGSLPVAAHPDPERVLVVGLASGVTAGAVLEDDRVHELTLVELEPRVVDASRFFEHVNGKPLDDPRTRLVIDDARAVLQRASERWDVIISEPSNPWISGISNLFTREYWALARSRLAPDGVFLQWVQLYGMGPDEMRALVRTFLDVFPETWGFVSVEGADLLLLGGAPTGRARWPQAPRLDPAGLAELAGEGWLNTDDHPRVEWRAPRYLHRQTGTSNADTLEQLPWPSP